MNRLLHTNIQERTRYWLLFLGLLIISAMVTLVFSASNTKTVVAEQDLSDYWRTSYDILVRPSNSRSYIEEKFNLVEVNHLSGISGGISFEQFESIRSMPGIEIAAPIAMIGYIPSSSIELDAFTIPNETGAYIFSFNQIDDYGVGQEITSIVTYHYYNPEAESRFIDFPIYLSVNRTTRYSYLSHIILLAGIDPEQEAALVNLDEAVIEGDYLSNDPLTFSSYTYVAGWKAPEQQVEVPILINSTSYIETTLQVVLEKVILPSQIGDLDSLIENGGYTFLKSLPSETLMVHERDSEELYQFLIDSFKQRNPSGHFLYENPGPLLYQESQSAFPDYALTLELVLPEVLNFLTWPAYRSFEGPGSPKNELSTAYNLIWKGVFDINKIQKPKDANRVPFETYFPPGAVLKYDEYGNSIEETALRPTNNPTGYIQSPPLILTTLEAAKNLRGEESISAIRIRVDGVNELSPSNQRKIEAIANEIIQSTNLEVDIMVGSSPTKVLVHIPGIGYAEEHWVQKNISLSYQTSIQQARFILLGILIVIGGFFTMEIAWADVLDQRSVIALQKSIGWRSGTVFFRVLRNVLPIGAISSLSGAILGWGVIEIFGWEPVSLGVLIGIFLAMVIILGLSIMYPAWIASQVLPILGFQQGIRNKIHMKISIGSIWEYAYRGLLRNKGRMLISWLTVALSGSLIVLLLGAVFDNQGFFGGTLLGEFILLKIEGYDYAIMAIGIWLAGSSVFSSLLSGLNTRKRELGVLMTVGWRNIDVTKLFVAEGMILGISGGVFGTILGLVLSGLFYESFSISMAWIGLTGIGIPAFISVLAALYPASLASRISPAETIRFS